MPWLYSGVTKTKASKAAILADHARRRLAASDGRRHTPRPRMARPAPRRLRRRSAGPKLALLHLLVLAIVAAPVTGNRIALVHAHGAEHAHVHVIPPALDPDLGTDPESLGEWH